LVSRITHFSLALTRVEVPPVVRKALPSNVLVLENDGMPAVPAMKLRREFYELLPG
jgi:hypothetical protein